MIRSVGSVGMVALLLLGGMVSSYGFEEIKGRRWDGWESVWNAPDRYRVVTPYVDVNGEIWTISEGHLYHLVEGQVERSEDLVPLANRLNSVVMVTPIKGWALADSMLLAYDGVFWSVVPALGGGYGI